MNDLEEEDDEDDESTSRDSDMPSLIDNSECESQAEGEEEAVTATASVDEAESERAQCSKKKKVSGESKTGSSEDTKESQDENVHKQKLIKEYGELRERPNDFKSRFSGHCNVATDIKECNYLGE
jgi:hypothetical protein